jgi:hypothetical protein
MFGILCRHQSYRSIETIRRDFASDLVQNIECGAFPRFAHLHGFFELLENTFRFLYQNGVVSVHGIEELLQRGGSERGAQPSCDSVAFFALTVGFEMLYYPPG